MRGVLEDMRVIMPKALDTAMPWATGEWRCGAVVVRIGFGQGGATIRRSSGPGDVRVGSFGRGCGMRRLDLDASDPSAVELDHREHVTVEAGGLADRRDMAELLDDVAGDGLVRAVGKDQAGLVLEVVEVEQAVDLELAGQRAGGLGLVDVVLVADVADQLLDQVLEGDDAGRAAVLVDDDGEVRALRGACRSAPRGSAGWPAASARRARSRATRTLTGLSGQGRAGRGRARSRRCRRTTRRSPGSASAAAPARTAPPCRPASPRR